MAGSLLTIHAVPQCCKHAQNGMFNKPGFNLGMPQLYIQPSPLLLKHYLAMMSWHFISINESESHQCSYRYEKRPSMPSPTGYACPRSPPPIAVMGGEVKLPNTFSSTAACFQKPSISSGTVSGGFQASSSFSVH
jgi:hypothetical protein